MQKALELLTEAKLGSSSHIIINTEINDLRAQQERVAISLRAVIEKVSNTFPNSKIIISTLLPCKDLHPYTIQKINTCTSRECALRPSTHLAHHPTLHTACLYDHVHLFNELAPVFAKTLKDVTLTCNVTTLQGKAGQNPNTQPSRRTPRPANRATPQALHLRPRHHAPHYPELQTRHHNNSSLPPAPAPMAGTHTAPLPQGPAPPPQKLQTRPGALTYSQAVNRPANPNNSELRDIQQMLSQICTCLMGHVLDLLGGDVRPQRSSNGNPKPG
ncbi:hypothetical protein MHYP_G00080850 [Metynnis hypsauchen]